jgi:hypothetical protein
VGKNNKKYDVERFGWEINYFFSFLLDKIQNCGSLFIGVAQQVAMLLLI